MAAPPQYATLAELYTYGAPTASYGALSDAQRNAGIQAASAELDGALRAVGTLKHDARILSWGLEVTRNICAIAAYELMSQVGFNPDLGSDRNYMMRAETARAWIKAVARNETHPDVVFPTDIGPATQPRMHSRRLRGF